MPMLNQNENERKMAARKEIAQQIMKKLGVHPDYILQFRTNGKVAMFEEGAFHAGYWVDKNSAIEANREAAAVIKKLENEGTVTVYAVISGDYSFDDGFGDHFPMQTYLLVTNQDVEDWQLNRNTGADPLNNIVPCVETNPNGTPCFSAYAYVVGLNNEFGYVGISGALGGITRVY